MKWRPDLGSDSCSCFPLLWGATSGGGTTSCPTSCPASSHMDWSVFITQAHHHHLSSLGATGVPPRNVPPIPVSPLERNMKCPTRGLPYVVCCPEGKGVAEARPLSVHDRLVLELPRLDRSAGAASWGCLPGPGPQAPRDSVLIKRPLTRPPGTQGRLAKARLEPMFLVLSVGFRTTGGWDIPEGC